MGHVLHGSARTTPRIRAELQASQESTRSLAACYGLDPKTVAKWRKRPTTADARMGPKAPKSTVLTPAEKAIVVAFRQKTLCDNNCQSELRRHPLDHLDFFRCSAVSVDGRDRPTSGRGLDAVLIYDLDRRPEGCREAHR